jgi:hypothetical protein
MELNGILSSTTLASLLGCAENTIIMASRSRNGNPPNIILSADKTINLHDKRNITWVRSFCSKKGISAGVIESFIAGDALEFETTADEALKHANAITQASAKGSTLGDDVDVGTEKKKKEIERLTISIEREKLELDRKKGNLMPTDAVTHIVKFNFIEFVNHFSNAAKSIASMYVAQMGGTDEDYTKLIINLNDIIAAESKRGVGNITEMIDQSIDDYVLAIKRGK